jgi:LPXTG-motif cell wall-anchored protein
MRYTKRWLAGTVGLSLAMVVGLAPAANADPITDLTSGLTQAVTGVVGLSGGTSAEQRHEQQMKPAAAPATPARKLHGEAPRGNTSSGTLDAGNSNGVNLGGIGLTAPIVVCGNAVNVVGFGADAKCLGENGSGSGANSSSGTLAGGNSNGVNAGGIAASVPIIICGNGVNVIGAEAEAGCHGTNGGTNGGGGNSSAGTLDAGNSNAINIGGVGASVPIVICGNAVNVIGYAAKALCEGQNGGSGPGGGGNSSQGLLEGGDSNGLNLGGIAATVPMLVCGNAINVIGFDADALCKGINEGHTPPPVPHCGAPYPQPGCTPPPPPSCTGSSCHPPPPPGCTGSGCNPPPPCAGPHPPSGCTPPPPPPGCTGSGCNPPPPPGCTGSGCNPPPPPGCTGSGCNPPPPPGCTGSGCNPPPPPGCGGNHPPAGCTPPPPGEHHHHQHGEEAGTLPVTGLDTTGIALAGLALVGLGSGALVAARRRREV